MTNFKIVYIVDFNIQSNSGKNKATLEKAKTLEKKIGKENFIFLNPPNFKSKIKKNIYRIYFDFFVLFKIISLKRNTIVIQRVLFLPFSRFVLFLKRIKVITEYHADFKEEIKHLGKSKIENIILYIISYFYNLNYYLSHGIIYNHPILKNKFDSKFKKCSIYSYNGANTEQFYPMDKNECRNYLGLDNDVKLFLFLGSVSKWHGVDLLINIFNEQIIINNSQIKLLIVGAKDNSFVSYLKRINLNVNTIFINPVDIELAKKYINSSEFCLLPVKQIRISPGSPLKLYDYIACGKPIITQDNLLGYSDEVLNHNLGYTINFENSKESANKIIEIINKSDEVFFKQNNVEMAKNHLNWDNRIDAWLKFCELIFSKSV